MESEPKGKPGALAWLWRQAAAATVSGRPWESYALAREIAEAAVKREEVELVANGRSPYDEIWGRAARELLTLTLYVGSKSELSWIEALHLLDEPAEGVLEAGWKSTALYGKAKAMEAEEPVRATLAWIDEHCAHYKFFWTVVAMLWRVSRKQMEGQRQTLSGLFFETWRKQEEAKEPEEGAPRCLACGGKLKNLWPEHGDGEFEGERVMVIYWRCWSCGKGHSRMITDSGKKGPMELAPYEDKEPAA